MLRLGRIPGAEPGIWRLSVAQTLIYAGLYYSFPGLLAIWEGETGWSKAELTLAFTLALIAWAAAAPFAGRLVDRGLGALALGGGCLAGGLLLMALALAEGRAAFVLLWIGIGAALAFCTYDPCFSLVSLTRGPAARRGITLITLVAGFAGTLAYPAAHLIGTGFGWRTTVAVFGAVVAGVAAPLAYTGARALQQSAVARIAPTATARHRSTFLGRPAFWCLCLAFAASAMAHSAVISHLLPMLAERGITPGGAVLAASMIGPMQVAGRLLMMAVERQRSNRVIAATAFFSLNLAALALIGSAGLPLLLAVFVVTQGGGIGVMSIMKPMVTRDILGTRDFGLITGALALPALLASAAAPYAGSLLWGLGTYVLVTEVVLALTIIALLAFLAAARGRPEETTSGKP